MPITWPTEFPDPQVSPYDNDAAYPVLKTDTNFRQVNLRQQYPKSFNLYNINFKMTGEQLIEFEWWLENEANNGLKWINDFPIIRNGRELIQVQLEEGGYYAKYIGDDYWQVSGVILTDETESPII